MTFRNRLVAAALLAGLVAPACSVNGQAVVPGQDRNSDARPPAGSSAADPDSAVTVGSGGGGQCALLVRFRGADYVGGSPDVRPEVGRSLGTIVVPPCNDHNGANDHAHRIRVAALRGISPDIAVVWREAGWILIRKGLDPIPRAVTRLMDPPACRDANGSITLRGQWLGIAAPHGETELDLVAPYHLEVEVGFASADRYIGATIQLRVPPALGSPLTREDLRTSLWEGGDLSAHVHCGPGPRHRFVVDEVHALPPS